MIKGIIFDLGNTLIHQVVDSSASLDRLKLKLVPSAKKCISLLAKHYKLAILSNTERTTSNQLEVCIKKLGLAKCNIAAFTSVTIGKRKPDPEAFLTVSQYLNVEPHEIIMVGNDIVEDIRGAQGVGMWTIHIGSSSKDSTVVPDLRVDKISSITPVLIDSLVTSRALSPDRGNTSGKQPNMNGLPKNPTTLSDEQDLKKARQIPEGLMLKAIGLEAKQEWRRIGISWLECAKSLVESDDILNKQYVDPEATTHTFPYFNLEYWHKLSHKEKTGRAFRYSGYHFEGDGDRQSAYRLYRRSAKCFEEDKKFDEAGRSHYLALHSYIKRFGDIESSFLDDLERTTQIFVNYDEKTFLRRMVIYYRNLSALLKACGNHRDYLFMRKKRIDAERKLLKTPKDYHLYLTWSIWNMLTGYGQSITRWFITVFAINLVLFPLIYRWCSCFSQHISFSDAFMFSIGRIANISTTNIPLQHFGNIVVLFHGFLNLFWIGALISIIVSRFQN